jgi:hypothetical protein
MRKELLEIDVVRGLLESPVVVRAFFFVCVTLLIMLLCLVSLAAISYFFIAHVVEGNTSQLG